MEFVCRLGTPEGRVVVETHEGHDREALRNDLASRGYRVFDIRPRGLLGYFPWSGRRRRPRRIPVRELLIFNQELVALLRAGMPLLQSLDIMLERMRDAEFRSVVTGVRERVESGEELSEAFAAYGERFPPLYASSLKAGERTGELERVLERFNRNQRLLMDARRRVTSALIYPAVLVCLSLALMLVMVLYVIPKFQEFYAGLGAELPAITRATLALSHFLRAHWGSLLLLALGAGFVLTRGRQHARAAAAWDRWKLRIPLLGGIFHRMALSEFGRALSTLLAGGIPLVPSLRVATRAVENRFVATRLEPTVAAVEEGQELHRALEESGVLPDLAIDMVKVGEATGSLAEMLSNLCDFFDEEVETRLERMLGLLEPLMLVMMGILVALLLISVYLPLINAMRQTTF